MKGIFKVAGHPVHAMVSDFPMVLLLAWVALDGGALLLRSTLTWMVGKWALIAGLAAAGIAAAFGFIDYIGISASRPKAARTATAHMVINLSAVGLALTVLAFRPTSPPTGLGLGLQLGGMVLVAFCLLAGGWFGGHLVFHHRVGTDEGSD